MKTYKCVATSFRAWVQQVAVSYVKRGYHQYVSMWIPEDIDAVAVDEKLIAKYNINISDSARLWRRKNNLVKVQYIRHGRFCVLLLSGGEKTVVMKPELLDKVISKYGENTYPGGWKIRDDGHVAIDITVGEGAALKHFYKEPLCYGGYEVKFRNKTGSVRIDGRYYKALQARFMHLARRADPIHIKQGFNELKLQPFGPIKSQIWKLIDQINEYRKKERLVTVPYSVAAPALRRVTGPLVVESGVDVGKRRCRAYEQVMNKNAA